MKADKAAVSRLLKTARGQVDGVLKMVEEDRYCMDICNQISAAEAVLKKARQKVLKEHFKSCVKESFENGTEDVKIEELIELFEKMQK